MEIYKRNLEGVKLGDKPVLYKVILLPGVFLTEGETKAIVEIEEAIGQVDGSVVFQKRMEFITFHVHVLIEKLRKDKRGDFELTMDYADSLQQLLKMAGTGAECVFPHIHKLVTDKYNK